MPMTPEKIAAYQKLDEAVQALIKADESFGEGQVVVAYDLLVAGARYLSPERDDDFEDGDEDLMASSYVHFPKIGSQPIMIRGLLETTLDRYRYYRG